MNDGTLATQSIVLTAMSHGYEVEFPDVHDMVSYYLFSQVGITRRQQQP